MKTFCKTHELFYEKHEGCDYCPRTPEDAVENLPSFGRMTDDEVDAYVDAVLHGHGGTPKARPSHRTPPAMWSSSAVECRLKRHLLGFANTPVSPSFLRADIQDWYDAHAPMYAKRLRDIWVDTDATKPGQYFIRLYWDTAPSLTFWVQL